MTVNKNSIVESLLVIGISLILGPLIVEVISTSSNIAISTNFTFFLIGVLIICYAGIKYLINKKR